MFWDRPGTLIIKTIFLQEDNIKEQRCIQHPLKQGPENASKQRQKLRYKYKKNHILTVWK